MALGAENPLTAESCPAHLSLQAETLPTCVRPGRCDCESAVGRGIISRSLPGVRGIRFELELELERKRDFLRFGAFWEENTILRFGE